jgi:hypothetical protein
MSRAVRIQLVCIPSSDTAFAAHAGELLLRVPAFLTPVAAAEDLQRRLQELYPGAVVRPREALADVGTDHQIVWYVTNRDYRSRIAASIEVRAPRDLVFDAYVMRIPEWQTAVRLREVRLTPALIGSEWTATWEFLGRKLDGVFRLTEVDPPLAVRFEASGMGVRVWYDTSFTPTATGTTVRVVGDYDVPDGILPKIVDRLFIERGIQRQIDNAHAALAELCRLEVERQAAS